MTTKGDNTPTNTLGDRQLREKVIDAVCYKPHIEGHLEQFRRIEALISEAVNKAEITMWEKTTKAMMDILQENFQYRLMCGEVRDPDGKIDVMQGFVKYQELEPERKKFSEYLEGLKLELNRDEAPNQEKQNES